MFSLRLKNWYCQKNFYMPKFRLLFGENNGI